MILPVQTEDHETVGSMQRLLAAAAALALVGIGAWLTPYAATALQQIPSYMLSFGLAMLITNLILAGLLFSRGNSDGNAGALYLGSAYFFVFAMFLPLIACFPDAIVKGSLIGGKLSAVWLWCFWHAGFGLLVLRYIWATRSHSLETASTGREIVLITAAVCLLATLGTAGLDYLPPIFSSSSGMFEGVGALPPVFIFALDAFAAVLLLKTRRPSAEQLWLGVGMVAACFDVWLTLRGGSRFTVGWYFSKLASLFTTAVVLVSLFNDLTRLYKRVSEANRLLASQVNVDGLTGLANRRAFDATLKREWARAARGNYPLCLMMIDVDRFKRFNDVYGHVGGDDCLRALAGAITAAMKRPSDMAARYGGEEFAVILPMTKLMGAAVVADHLRSAVQDLRIPHAASEHSVVTLSIGIAQWRPGTEDLSGQLIEAADRQLYRAKDSGRNRVCTSDTDTQIDTEIETESKTVHPTQLRAPASPANAAANEVRLEEPVASSANVG
jgi:diguanylate cyclase (GGDEF)-like protein